MTDKEIIRALRCYEKEVCADGDLCPLFSDADCIVHLHEAAIDLIERLTAENAALREEVPQWISVDDRHPQPGTRVLATDGVFVGEAYRTRADRPHISEEIADVQIMLEQMMMLYECHEDVSIWRHKKVNRLYERLIRDGCIGGNDNVSD